MYQLNPIASYLTESTVPTTIDSLEDFYDECEYGIVIGGKKYIGSKMTSRVISKCHIMKPDEFFRYKCGMCYDTVGYSDYYLTKWNVEHRIFLQTTRKYYNKEKGIWDDPTHTFLIYKNNDDGKWWWLEGSWGKFKGNEFREDDPMALVRTIKTFLKRNLKGHNIHIKELKKYPNLGMNIHEFYKQMMINGTDVAL